MAWWRDIRWISSLYSCPAKLDKTLPGQLGSVLKDAWVVSAVATALIALLISLMIALYFDMSYGQPADTYTGQDWDRAASWLMLTPSMAAIALAVLGRR
jgi:hypothetical protein